MKANHGLLPAFHPPTALPGLSQVVRAIANSPEWFIALFHLEEADQVSGGSMHVTCCFVINSCTFFMDSFGKFFWDVLDRFGHVVVFSWEI